MNIRFKTLLNIGVVITVVTFLLTVVVLPAVALGADSGQAPSDEQGAPPDTVSSPAKGEQKKDVSTSTEDIEYDDSYDDDDDEWEG